jgi:outer membrane protein OmpA-like peptidoglycan-associated protein
MMSKNLIKTSQSIALGLALVGAVTTASYAQDSSTTTPQSQQTSTSATQTSTQTTQAPTTQAQTQSRSVTSGQKMKIKGVVTHRDPDTFTVRDANGVETVVRLTDRTSVKTKGGFLRGGTNYATTNILRGLNLEVEGRGDGSGQLVAEKVRFNDSDLRVAQSIESRVNPVEDRVSSTETRLSQAEQNAQRLSGQIDELAAVSNAARGGAKAAQDTADAAVAGVNATNERISALDDYVPQDQTSVNFRSGSAVLSPTAKTQLDDIATKAMAAKGYVIEISGYADARGGADFNRRLSQRRADAVVRYLAENHRIPLRRIVTPFGYGASQAVADNTTREGRAQNRRVEVKVLVSKGLTQPAPTINTPTTTTNTSTSTARPN